MNNDLEMLHSSSTDPFNKKYKMRTQPPLPGKKENRHEQKARRKEIMNNLRANVKGSVEHLNSENQKYESDEKSRERMPKVASMTTKKHVHMRSNDSSKSRSPIRYENSQLPVLDHLVKGNFLQ